MTTTDVFPSVPRADVSPETATTTTTQSPPIVVPIKTEQRQRVEPSCSSAATRHIDRVLRRRVIGQDDALDALMSSFARLFSGLRDPGRPVLTGLLLGPTGVGKTETARALSMALFGSDDGVTRINCEEYAHGHEMAKLLGAPPGYVGYQIEPLLSQARIDAAHRQALAEGRGLVAADRRLFEHTLPGSSEKMLSIVLFDEIEKAHPMVWNALLGILDNGTLTLGNNQTVDFTRSIVLLTSNVGGQEMSALLDPQRLGFQAEQKAAAKSRTSLTETAMTSARRTFPAEFLNRFDEIRVYSPLSPSALERILDRFLNDLHERADRGGDAARDATFAAGQGVSPRTRHRCALWRASAAARDRARAGRPHLSTGGRGATDARRHRRDRRRRRRPGVLPGTGRTRARDGRRHPTASLTHP